MEAQTGKKGRGIWTDEENKYLISVVQGKKQMSWNEIASELSKTCGTHKSGKQCRERYRNYADPALEKSEWRPQEKILFLVLHKLYSNQWSNIAKHLNQRSDVAVKNYFYSITRRALKHFKSQSVPVSILKKPTKLYQTYIVLSLIRECYLPIVRDKANLPKYSHKEKIILNLLNERNITDESIQQYQDLLVNRFREAHKPSELPKEITISLQEFKFSSSKVEELLSSDATYNPAPLSQMVSVRIIPTTPSAKEVSTAVPQPPPQLQSQPVCTQPQSQWNPFAGRPTLYCMSKSYLSGPQSATAEETAAAMLPPRFHLPPATMLPNLPNISMFPTINPRTVLAFLPPPMSFSSPKMATIPRICMGTPQSIDGQDYALMEPERKHRSAELP